jgi:tRNA modification GTPase
MVHSRADERGPPPPGSLTTSVRADRGLEQLLGKLRQTVSALLPPVDLTLLNRRQRQALSEAAGALAMMRQDDLVIAAELLRQALAALDRLTGRASTEDVLDAVFSRFCLGK